MPQPTDQGARSSATPREGGPLIRWEVGGGGVWETGSKGQALFVPGAKEKRVVNRIGQHLCVESRVSAISDVLRCFWWGLIRGGGGAGHLGSTHTARQAMDGLRTEVCGRQKQSHDPRNNQHSPGTPTTGPR